jgi:hypothetical protein
MGAPPRSTAERGRDVCAPLDQFPQVSTLSSVELRILPARRTGTAVWRSSTSNQPADDSPAVVTTELLHGVAPVSDPEAGYDHLWSRLWSTALSGDAVSAIRAVQ